MGRCKVAHARIQSLFNFIDAIKYTKSTMVDDPCMAQWSRKFVYVCMCFEGFLVFCFCYSIYKNIRPVYAWWKKKMKWSSWGVKQKLCLQRIFNPPPKDKMVEWKLSAMKLTANQRQEQTMVSWK